MTKRDPVKRGKLLWQSSLPDRTCLLKPIFLTGALTNQRAWRHHLPYIRTVAVLMNTDCGAVSISTSRKDRILSICDRANLMVMIAV
jgi:hypothetical protein